MSFAAHKDVIYFSAFLQNFVRGYIRRVDIERDFYLIQPEGYTISFCEWISEEDIFGYA